MKKVLLGVLMIALTAVGIYSCTKQEKKISISDDTDFAQDRFSGDKLKSRSVFQSVTTDNKYVRITLTQSNDTVFYTREDIAANSAIKSVFYNRSDISFVGDSLLIPNTDYYCFIPFESVPPIQLRIGTTLHVRCDQWCCCDKAPYNGVCQFTGSGEDRICDCSVTIPDQPAPCKVDNSLAGAGVLIKARVAIMI